MLNAYDVKQVEDLSKVLQESENLKREMAEFKHAYSEKVIPLCLWL
jgi:hypothetical protein